MYRKLNAISRFFITCGIIAIIVFLGIIIYNNLNKDDSKFSSASADGFYIDNFDIVLNVNENNIIDVKEDITVNFYESGHHGIFRVIPSWLKYTSKDKNTISRKAEIYDLVCYSDEYSVRNLVNDKKEIKMGNPYKTLDFGQHTYQIGYSYDMGADPYKGFDEFIFHAFGNYWGTPIQSGTIEINMPKTIDSNTNIKFFVDKYRKQEVTDNIITRVEDSKIIAMLQPNESLNSALTIDVELPDNYFSRTSNDNYGKKSFYICLACIGMAIFSGILWKRFGKDLDKVPTTVELYPPENYDAAQIGYLYKRTAGKSLAAALIVELASKGFLKIENEEIKNIQFLTIKNADITEFDKYINRKIKIVKLKEYNNGKLSIFDSWTYLMHNYFKDSDEAEITEDLDNFYKKNEIIMKRGYFKVVYDTLNDYTEEQILNIKNQIQEKEDIKRSKMTDNERIVYDELFKEGDTYTFTTYGHFYRVFSKLDLSLSSEFDDKNYDIKGSTAMVFSSIGFCICTILLGMAFCFIKDMDPQFKMLYYAGAISNIVTLIFSILMDRKTEFGEKMSAKISGFKNYLELAEKDTLEAEVEKNPNYFYDILPYAFVLNVSKKWISKFENISIPHSDLLDCNLPDVLDSISTSVNNCSSPSSGSSGGGGCSSCGGGCSSCGGGGSW